MSDLDSAELAAIVERVVIERKFLWIKAKNRETGADESRGFWNDVRTVTMPVRDGRTGEIVDREFYGLGPALQFGTVSLTSDLTIRKLDIELPHLDEIVNLMVRGYDVRGAPMQHYRGFFNPTTRILVAPAKSRFVGYIDGAPIVTPKEGDEGSITLHCVSTTRELTRTNPDVCSHESQLARSGGTDFFYKDIGTAGDREIAWGTNRAPLASVRTTPHNPSGGA